jgi:hypothetical protein
MAVVLYDGKKIIPAPLISIHQEKVRSQGGVKIGNTFAISVEGTLTARKGSPKSDGSFWTASGYPPDESPSTIPPEDTVRLGIILRKQEALRHLFRIDGKAFEAQSLDGSAPLKCYPRVKDITFDKDLWYDKCNYKIDLEADVIEGLNSPIDEDIPQFISNFSETWELDEDEATQSYKLTHRLSAVGKTHYDDTHSEDVNPIPAWQQAKDFIINKLNNTVPPILNPSPPGDPNTNDPNTDITGGFLTNVTGLDHFNRTRKETIDESGGGYSVDESWVLTSPGTKATEDYNIQTRFSRDDPTPKYSITGTITGLREQTDAPQFGVNPATSEKFINAKTYWSGTVSVALSGRISTVAGIGATLVASNQTVEYFPYPGQVKYTYEYISTAGMCFPGALSEDINIVDSGDEQVFASIPVIGRASGPILQDIGTIKEKTREIAVAVRMPPATGIPCGSAGLLGSKPNSDSLILDLKPAGSVVFKGTDQETWNRKTGQYNRRVIYTYES